jgi:hypothetical protein
MERMRIRWARKGSEKELYASGSMLDLVGKREMDTAEDVFVFFGNRIYIAHHVSRDAVEPKIGC